MPRLNWQRDTSESLTSESWFVNLGALKLRIDNEGKDLWCAYAIVDAHDKDDFVTVLEVFDNTFSATQIAVENAVEEWLNDALRSLEFPA
ncbi:MAG: hypothetical protein AAF267_20580 [Deinococcota bacterium]